MRVPDLVGLLPIKVFLQQRLHFRDPCGTSDEDNFVNLRFLQPSVFHRFLHRTHGLSEKIVVQLLKAGSRERLREIQSFEERLDLHADLVLVGQRTLSSLSFATELLHSFNITRNVLSVLPLDELDEVFHDALIEVLTWEKYVRRGC